MEDHAIRRALDPDEEIHVEAPAGDQTVVVTAKRLAIGSRERLALDVPIDNLRRISSISNATGLRRSSSSQNIRAMSRRSSPCDRATTGASPTHWW
jgi:hypothetical protein